MPGVERRESEGGNREAKLATGEPLQWFPRILKARLGRRFTWALEIHLWLFSGFGNLLEF